jgi:hypothetical protein
MPVNLKLFVIQIIGALRLTPNAPYINIELQY